MRFRLFGVPVDVQLGFWLMAGLLGAHYLRDPQAPSGATIAWVAVVFVSVLIHELGHAYAIVRRDGAPAITLHMLGGLTTWRATPERLTRSDRVMVSFSGPLAGFLVAGAVYAVHQAAPTAIASLPPLGRLALENLFFVNFYWGLFNLIPVLPFDGGHMLEAAMGPQRQRATAWVSLVSGLAIVAYVLLSTEGPGRLWIVFIVGFGVLQSFRRVQLAASEADGPASEPSMATPEPDEEPATGSASAQPEGDAGTAAFGTELALAQRALERDAYDEAGTMAEAILDQSPRRQDRLAALHVLGWAYLLRGDGSEARRVLEAIERSGAVDPALAGAVLFGQGELGSSRQLLESAYVRGDSRKSVVGPLIQILISQGEIDRAAAIAFDIVDSLSEDDARQMAQIALDRGSASWSAKLSEAIFERAGSADDAYDAARARALVGDKPGAIALLRRAVAAGFSDAARAWSDKALERLRSSHDGEAALEAVLPRPADS